jgi:hypothetical protein
MSGWFQTQVVDKGRLPLFCFFVAFLLGFGFIRLSVRLIRAGIRWWPGNVVAGQVHVLRLPVIRAKIRVVDLLTGSHDQPPPLLLQEDPLIPGPVTQASRPGAAMRAFDDVL